jgi:hypothetical protein
MLPWPLAEPLLLALQVRGRQAREPLGGLNAHGQLELACRRLAGILAAFMRHQNCQPLSPVLSADRGSSRISPQNRAGIRRPFLPCGKPLIA